MLASCQENLPETRAEERGGHTGAFERVPAVRPQVKARLLYLAGDEGHSHGTKTVFVPLCSRWSPFGSEERIQEVM